MTVLQTRMMGRQKKIDRLIMENNWMKKNSDRLIKENDRMTEENDSITKESDGVTCVEGNRAVNYVVRSGRREERDRFMTLLRWSGDDR